MIRNTLAMAAAHAAADEAADKAAEQTPDRTTLRVRVDVRHAREVITQALKAERETLGVIAAGLLAAVDMAADLDTLHRRELVHAAHELKGIVKATGVQYRPAINSQPYGDAVRACEALGKLLEALK